MSYSPQATQSPRLNEVSLSGTTTIENDFPYRSPKLNHNNNNNNNNNLSPIANYPPAYFHPSGSSNESSRGSSTSFPAGNSVGAAVEEVYPAESYAMPQSRGSSSGGLNNFPEGATPSSIIEGGGTGVTGVEGGIYQSQQRPPQSQEEWEESQQRNNLPQQYDYSRRASEANYPYDRNTTNGPSPISSNSPIPPRPGSADGYFYVAPTTTIASHLAIPPERDAPLYYNYGGYSSQPTYNHPNFAGSAFSASGSTPNSFNSELPLLAATDVDSTGNLKSKSARTSPASGPAAPLYEKEGGNTDERNFKCDQCPHAFHRNHDLKRHKRIHLEIKPYPCHWCSKRFTRKDALKRHLLVKQHPAAPNVDGELPPVATPTAPKKTTKKMSKAAAAAAAAAASAIGGQSSRRSSAGESSHQSMTDEIDDDQDFQPKREVFEGGISPQYLPPPNRSPTLAGTDLPLLDNSMNNLVSQPTRALSSRTRKSTGAPQYDYNETMDDEDEEEEDREFKERKLARERHQAKERELEEEMDREEQQEQSRHQLYQQQQHQQQQQQHQQHQQQHLHHQQQLQAQQNHEHQQHQLYQQQLQQSQEQHYPQSTSHNSHNNNNNINNDNSQLHQSQSHHEQQQQHQQQYRAYYPL